MQSSPAQVAMALPPEKRAGLPSTRPILSNRNFVLLWCAYTISALGDHLSEVALLDMQGALNRPDSTRIMAMIMFALFLPFFVLGTGMGWLADRLPRKWLMITADVIRAAIMFLLFPFFMWLFAALRGTWLELPITGPHGQPLFSPWVYCAPIFALGVFAAMFSPARSALLPSLVRQDQLVRANGLMSAMGPIAAIVSYYLGAWLAEKYGARACFRSDALTFVASAMFILFIAAPRGRSAVVRSSNGSGIYTLTEGFRYVRSHRRIAELILFAVIFWAPAGIVRSTIPALVHGMFGGHLGDIANYTGALGIGMLAGAALLSALGDALRSELAISWSFTGAGIAISCLALADMLHSGMWIGAICLFFCGLFGSGILVSAMALLQKLTPSFMRGRVIGVNDFASMGGLLIATGALAIPVWRDIDTYVPGLLGVTGAGLMLAGWRITRIRLRRGRFGGPITFWRNLFEFHARALARVRRRGICTVPLEGPVIVAANHNASIDPFLLIATSPNRYMSFMIAREFTRIPVFSRLIRMAECIPVNRTGVDIASVKTALRHLAAGKAVGIFPQGRIVAPDDWHTVQEGIGLLALRSGATVIPAYLSGTRHSKWVAVPMLWPQRARVRYGKPIDLSAWAGREKDRAAYREVAEHIMERIRALKDDPAEAVPGGGA